MRRSALLAAAAGCAIAAAHAEAPFDFDKTPGKLPKTVVPSAYKIDISPDLKKLTLTGHETVDVEFRAATDAVTLNQAGLTLTDAKLENGASAKIATDEKAQTATLTFPAKIAAGRHRLTIAYTGPIPQTPNGIYYDDYKTPSGEQSRMLVTQFEAADARRMFPGWDEPAFKATFELSATLPKALVPVSNTPVARVVAAGPDTKRVEFQTTPRMSTYLLALVAGDMAALRGGADGTAINAFAPRGEEPQASYALDVAKQVLPYYNTYFGVAYPLPKLDLIAIPGNFEAGAMENWGAITFVDNDMLVDPAKSSADTAQRVYMTTAHEMAHQWSGDLVTMGWWDDIWLNEGFATWMETKAADHFHPEWQIWPRDHAFHEAAMAQDALPTTHAIHQVIHDESEANSAFDQISYQKGEQVIRMIEDWLGPDVFRDGMRRYMKAHAYGNATSADLWAALDAASGKDVGKVAAAFTEQPGVPLIMVNRHCEAGKATLTLAEDRFAINDPHAKKLAWVIPVTYGAPGEAPHQILLGPDGATVPIAGCDAPLKLNWNENGYYRTQYDSASLAALRPVFTRLGGADKANLLADQYALFAAGRASLTDYLDLLPLLKDETSLVVWQDTAGQPSSSSNSTWVARFERLDAALAGSPLRAAFDRFAVAAIQPEFARLGWETRAHESALDTLLRPQLIAALGLFGDTAVVEEAKRRFAEFLKDPVSLPAALRDPVTAIVGHHADQATYDKLKSLGIAAPGTEEKLRYFFAMASASDPALIRQTVDFADAGQVPNGRVALFLARASATCGSPDLFFRLVQPRAAALSKRLPQGGIGPSVLVAAAAGSSNPDIAAQLLADKTANESAGKHVWTLRVADMIETRADLRRRAEPALAAWLKEKG